MVAFLSMLRFLTYEEPKKTTFAAETGSPLYSMMSIVSCSFLSQKSCSDFSSPRIVTGCCRAHGHENSAIRQRSSRESFWAIICSKFVEPFSGSPQIAFRQPMYLVYACCSLPLLGYAKFTVPDNCSKSRSRSRDFGKKCW